MPRKLSKHVKKQTKSVLKKVGLRPPRRCSIGFVTTTDETLFGGDVTSASWASVGRLETAVSHAHFVRVSPGKELGQGRRRQWASLADLGAARSVSGGGGGSARGRARL